MDCPICGRSNQAEETTVWIEKYFPLVARDTEEAMAALETSLPDQVKSGIEAELRRLQELNRVLSGETEKSQVHVLRARLRWKRQEAKSEREAAKRKVIEREIAGIEADIKRTVEQRRERK
jgi:wobble nucleotide-excising tRNase